MGWQSLLLFLVYLYAMGNERVHEHSGQKVNTRNIFYREVLESYVLHLKKKKREPIAMHRGIVWTDLIKRNDPIDVAF